jgi:hypothetical protein
MLASWAAHPAAGEPAAAGPAAGRVAAAAGLGSGRTAGSGRSLGLEERRIPGEDTVAEPVLGEGSCSGIRLGVRRTHRPVRRSLQQNQ